MARAQVLPAVLLAIVLGASTSAAALRGLQGTPACAWKGHCLGDPCRTENDCDQNWICISRKCAVPGPKPPPKKPPTPPPASASKRTTITSYNVMSSDNTAPGELAEHQVSRAFVNHINIAAVHSKHWRSYKYRQVQITYKGKTGTFQVWDFCSDNDCDGCCTDNLNYNNNGFLLDLDSSAVKRIWGISKAEKDLFDSATFVLLSTPVDVQGELAQYP